MPVLLNHLREKLQKAQEVRNCIFEEDLLCCHLYQNEEIQLANLIDRMIKSIADEIRAKEKRLNNTLQK